MKQRSLEFMPDNGILIEQAHRRTKVHRALVSEEESLDGINANRYLSILNGNWYYPPSSTKLIKYNTMKTWTPITIETLANYLLPVQLSALRNNTDPLKEIIEDTIARVHSEINSNPSNPKCPDPSLVPQELKTSTCHLIVEALQSRIPTLQLSNDQIRNANNARIFLKRIATAEVPINPPNSSAPSNTISIAHKRQRQTTHNSLLGL